MHDSREDEGAFSMEYGCFFYQTLFLMGDVTKVMTTSKSKVSAHSFPLPFYYIVNQTIESSVRQRTTETNGRGER